jgi:hypothetical protein
MRGELRRLGQNTASGQPDSLAIKIGGGSSRFGKSCHHSPGEGFYSF